MSNHIRQRLLESENMNLQHILDKVRSLDAAQKNFEEFSIAQAGFKPDNYAAVIHRPPVDFDQLEQLTKKILLPVRKI